MTGGATGTPPMMVSGAVAGALIGAGGATGGMGAGALLALGADIGAGALLALGAGIGAGAPPPLLIMSATKLGLPLPPLGPCPTVLTGGLPMGGVEDRPGLP